MANQLVPWLLCLNVRQAQVRDFIQFVEIRKDDRLILYPRWYSLWAWRRGLGEDPAGCLWEGRAGTWPASPWPSGITTAEMQFKGTVPRDFRLLVFSWISCPKHLSVPLRSFRIFSKIPRRSSRLKVHHRRRWHRWQMEKIFNQKFLLFCLDTFG